MNTRRNNNNCVHNSVYVDEDPKKFDIMPSEDFGSETYYKCRDCGTVIMMDMSVPYQKKFINEVDVLHGHREKHEDCKHDDPKKHKMLFSDNGGNYFYQCEICDKPFTVNILRNRIQKRSF